VIGALALVGKAFSVGRFMEFMECMEFSYGGEYAVYADTISRSKDYVLAICIPGVLIVLALLRAGHISGWCGSSMMTEIENIVLF
jgi:hypothetical protein